MMTPDPKALGQLLEESQDLHADALRSTHDGINELIERSHARPDEEKAANLAFHEQHQRSLRSSFGATTILGAAGAVGLVSVLATSAAAANSSDVQILQTAASIENLAVSTYKTALTLPYIGGSAADPVVTKFAQVTMGQHAQHADAFNAAAKHLGGKAQNKPDPAFVPVVNKAVASLNGVSASQGSLGVVALALELENIAAETYVNDTTLAKSTSNKALFASIMGIEAQHVSVLLAVQALLKAGAPQDISLSPSTAAMLPSAAGAVGFPNAFYKTNMAAPAEQGAVK
jgi:Ferritin-like domain